MIADRFRTFRASVEIPLEVRADGPLLVMGPDAPSPERPDLAFVRYPTPLGEAPFLPGSSLKGVLRSGTEALLRGLGRRVCDAIGQESCSRSRDVRQGRAPRCAACLLYGSTLGASAVLVDDGLPWRPGDDDDTRRARLAAVDRSVAVRQSVAVDRQTGAAQPGALFDYEVLVDASFFPAVRLRNPEPWHVCAVAAALRLLDAGLLRVGSGTTRGLGRVRAGAEGVTVRALRDDLLEPLTAAAGFGDPRSNGLFRSCDAIDPTATLAAWTAALAERVTEVPA